jgi:uncharacterized protein YdhG (YjbR/CyaY superfamily)
MQIAADSPEEYISKIPTERKATMQQLRSVIKSNLTSEVEECINYGMIGYVIPHSVYPDGYHVNPELPLPFIHIASQKNFIALYHSGIYMDEKLMNWFVNEYPKNCKTKLDMGKSCIRFKKINDIPFELIGKLSRKMSGKEFIHLYESNLRNK